jgi:hypothetical protein
LRSFFLTCFSFSFLFMLFPIFFNFSIFFFVSCSPLKNLPRFCRKWSWFCTETWNRNQILNFVYKCWTKF